jgi:hypothetical protein
MNKETKKMLSLNATKIRIGIIEGTHSAKAGHPEVFHLLTCFHISTLLK